MLPDYAELHCRSNFSFLTGASHPAELVERAQALGYRALAITDEGTLAGVVRAHVAAKERGLPLIIGAEMRLSDPRIVLVESVDQTPEAHPEALSVPPAEGQEEEEGGGATAQPAAPKPRVRWPTSPPAEQRQRGLQSTRLVLLAMTRGGYGNLSKWITVARRRAAKGHYLAYASDLEGRVPTVPQLAGLPGCFALLVPEPVWIPGAASGRPPKAGAAAAALQGDADLLGGHFAAPEFETLLSQARWLKAWFGEGRAALSLSLRHRAFEDELVEVVTRVAEATGLPIAASGDVLMHVRSRKPLQDVLAATRLKRPVAACGLALEPSAEAHLRVRSRLAELYKPAWLAQSVHIAEQCEFSLDELSYEYPQEIVPAGHSPTSWLRELTERGALRRFPGGVPGSVRDKIEMELGLIRQLKFEAFFLTVEDLVRWARSQGILCQGRGSAANSVVCYCLGVTAVSPKREESLLFGRFISVERNEPPDIDVDFEHQRREEVIQYIYKKYGRHRAALTGVVICYRARSALRDTGRALGLDLDRIEAVARSQQWWEHGGPKTPEPAPPGQASAAVERELKPRISPERLRENGFDPESPLIRLWSELTAELRNFPRHLSQHPGGFLIAREDIAELVPVENATMDNRTVIERDKDDLDALRLIKVDVLALGMLSAIRRALTWVDLKEGRGPGRELEMAALPEDDPVVYDMLCDADSVGLFQVESRAQMSMLPRLRPREYYDLVVQVAIVRPGPIQGGMVHPFLKRRSGEEPVVYPGPEVKKALERTQGVPIFQEQVMQIAMLAADFSAGEADQLRRAMAAWKRNGSLAPFHDRLVGRMVDKGYERDYAEAIFKQMEGFGEYGFPESHAASFALLVYVSAWLKRYHPDAFLAALLDSQPMGFYAPAQLVRDARAHGVQVLPVDVTVSGCGSTLEALPAPVAQPSATSARPPPHSPPADSLRAVRLGLNRLAGLSDDAAERIVRARAEAPFNSIEDLTRRAALDARTLRLLADGNALLVLAGHRHQAAWAVAGIDTRATALLKATPTHEPDAPALEAPAPGLATLADYRSTGLSLGDHPVALLREQLNGFKVLPAALLRECRPGQLVRASGLVTHRQRPGTAKGVVFVTLEDDTGAVNVIVWPQVVEQQRRPLLAARLLTVYGIWQREGAVMHLVAKKLIDHTPLLQGLSTRSRDFH